MLEKAYREQKRGKVPTLPLWLSPTQVRILPISDKFTEEAGKVAEEISRNHIRVDLDDRPLTMHKKIREAEREWINYIIVIGQREMESNILAIRDRRAGKIKKMKLDALVKIVLKEIKGKPFRQLPLPRRLSQRPQFCG